METIRKVEVKKSILNAQTNYDFELLTKSESIFVPLSIERREEEYLFHYNVNGLTMLSEIKKIDLLDRYRLLISIIEAKPIMLSRKFSLNPDNIYVDYNYNAFVMFRDVYGKEDVLNKELFREEFLCLLGELLQKQYKYNDYKNSGVNLLNKNKETNIFLELENIQIIKNKLIELFESEKSRRNNLLISVDKKRYLISTWIYRICAILMIVGLLSSGYLYFYQYQHEQQLNEAYRLYINTKYIDVVDTLSSVDRKRMDKTSKYILAISYIRTDALTTQQKENILSGVLLSSNERILDYWVYLSKGEVDDAIDIAKLIGDDEYLLYAYMKKKDVILQNGSITGSEKEAQLNEIEKLISEFERKQTIGEE